MNRVLVGTDGSPPAARGVAWAAGLARALGTEIVVASAVTELAGSDAAEANIRDRVAAALDGPWSAPAHGDGLSVTTLVLDGDPRVVLLDAAASQNADVLVLGSAGTSWFPALHLGHVAHAVAHHCTLPVVIVPPGAATTMTGPLLVGVDGSAGSAAAVAWTSRLAPRLGCQVIAVHVQMRERTDQPHPDDRELERHCDDWAAPLKAAGVPTRIVIAQGWPASAIVDLEAIEAPGLVVLGARGAGGFRDLRLGSVALGVLQRSMVPVAIVPQSDLSLTDDEERGG